MNLPTIISDNNFHIVTFGPLTVYFSYKTPIAFEVNGNLVIRQNDWSTTTGKHLNAVNDNKSIRVTSEEFNKQYVELVAPMFNADYR